MPTSVIVDLLLGVVLLSFFVSGYRSGLLRSVSVIAGIVAGGIAAFFVVPLVGSWVPDAQWRTAATLAAAVLLVLAGLSIGQFVGHAIRRSAHRTKLRIIDRLLGAVLTTVVSALVLSMLAFSIGSLGVPFLSPAIASSRVLQAIQDLTPDPVQGYLAKLRSVVVDDGIPLIVDAFTGTVPGIPEVDTGNPALTRAALSVVRITGNAYACGQNQSGSGFVIAKERVLTNAHVVAGVTEPVVESATGGALPGAVVYFDPVDDLAVIAVTGLSAPPLQLTSNLTPGSTAVTDGYSFGGPFGSDPAAVISVGTLAVADIYGASPTPRQVYTLAADVQHGDSGGPLLSQAGLVAGVVFAKSLNTPKVGYALAMEEVQPVAALAAALNGTVSSGDCIRD